MEVEARETERMAATGAWKAWADSRRARATTADFCMTVTEEAFEALEKLEFANDGVAVIERLAED
jgi:hypothetical protein